MNFKTLFSTSVDFVDFKQNKHRKRVLYVDGVINIGSARCVHYKDQLKVPQLRSQ